MRTPHSLMFPLLLACPLLLAACGNTQAPDSAEHASAADARPADSGRDPAAPPPMSSTAAQGNVADEANGGVAAAERASDMTPTTGEQSGARARIDSVLGDAQQYESVFNAFRKAVASGDRPAVVEQVRFPLNVAEGRKIRDPGEFMRNYERIITPAVKKVVAEAQFDDVSVSQRGVMLGDGQVWLNGECQDAGCTRSDVKVITIQ